MSACRLWYICAVAFTYRLRYYFAWAVSESALIFSGLCFNGYDEQTGKVPQQCSKQPVPVSPSMAADSTS